MGALYREATGELARSKFSLRSIIAEYDTYVDSLLTDNDLNLIQQMYEFDIDINIEVELSQNPKMKISMMDYKDGSLVNGRELDSNLLSPTEYGDLGGDFPGYEFMGRLGSLRKIIFIRVFKDKVGIGIVEEAELEYREMFEIKRRTNRLGEFGKDLSSSRRWFPVLEELNEVVESVSPVFGFKNGLD